MLRLFYDDKDLVISSSRYPKPISQVAENITIITADDIDAMNAHSVAEVLDRVPGLFISSNRDFGANSLINMQGSEPRHTLILVDDIPLNFINEGSADTITVPVGIIDRIEIIKGPASSAWGSSLGGVINIITKAAGNTQKPAGSIHASYGKGSSQDYRADLSGKVGKARYYLYAGALDSDGLVGSRFSDIESIYSKIELPVSGKVNTGFSIKYSNAETGLGDFPDYDTNIMGSIQSFYMAPYLNAKITSDIDLRFSGYYLRQEIGQESNALGQGMVGQAGDLYLGIAIKEESWGGKGQAVLTKENHTVVFGVDFERGEYDQVNSAGSFLQLYGVPAVSRFFPDNTKWALYANDTITRGKWSVIPGIRYDHESVTGSFLSPSLGITYVPKKNTILRATVARGFTTPSLLWTSGGGLFLDPNQVLEHEEIWSYQAGVESAFSFLWVRANLFLHDMEKYIIRDPFGGGPPAFYDIYINDGEVRRKGIEIDFETAPVHNITLWGGLSYVDGDPPNSSGSSEIYSYAIGAKYDDNTLRVQLFGYYNWYDLNYLTGASYDDFLWDLNINRKIQLNKGSDMEMFIAARNLFNGFQYDSIGNIDPKRWLEAGIKFRF
ncbi:TonB-dependent receptor plug domain-containing protein [Thermodesulfobacteriota bacterium]